MIITLQDIAITEFEKIDDHLMEFLKSENERQNTNLNINFVRPTRPELPQSLDRHYLDIAEEKTKKKVSEEKMKRLAIENEISLQEIVNQNKIAVTKMETKQKEASIQNQMTIADAEAAAKAKKLEADALMEFFKIPDYAELEKVKAISRNEKIYYGEKLPLNFPLLSTK
tara:strand:+ start:461 stop:970 length:510 start_codon:yes stop_codon:yes gene_type:complete